MKYTGLKILFAIQSFYYGVIRTVTILLFLLAANLCRAQLCPGGGTSFSNAIMYDPAWVYGCNTGTSCNGGVNFDNRFSCEPTIAMDNCAPNPSCGIVAQNASDIWFKFYPTFPNVVISSLQNTSFVVSIQAFRGSSCGTLTEIGCAKAGGPSSGVQLTLNGLDPSELYYFRIFGSSHTTPQRTGIYCFCGTTGLQAYLLPLSFESLKAVTTANQVELSFEKPSAGDVGVYEIEHSMDAISFKTIYRLSSSSAERIVYTHNPNNTLANYYRLKRSLPNGQYHYSSVVKVMFASKAMQVLHNGLKKEVTIEVYKRTTVTITDLSGRLLKTKNLDRGLHRISTASFSGGIYLVHNDYDNKAYKFLVQQ